MLNNAPLILAFGVSLTLSTILTFIINDTIVQLKATEKEGAVPVLNYFYWSTNVVTLALAYMLFY